MIEVLMHKADGNATATIATEVVHAKRFFTRLRGLMGKKAISEEGGVLLSPCSQVHTLGMRFPLDLVFLNADGEIIKCVRDLPPARFAAAKGARHTLELAAGRIDHLGIEPGDYLQWRPRNARSEQRTASF